MRFVCSTFMIACGVGNVNNWEELISLPFPFRFFGLEAYFSISDEGTRHRSLVGNAWLLVKDMTIFVEWAKVVIHALRPGGHVFIASNAFLSQLVFSALIDGGLEFRGELIRLVRTLRGGDRPKNAEQEFPGVSSMPRGCYEPWGILRKPLLPGMKLSDCLREFQTGGVRRIYDDKPFNDLRC